MMQHMDAEWAVEPEGKNLDRSLTRPRGWVVGLFAPDAEAEAEELAEIDLLEPDGLTLAKLLAEDERVAPLPHQTGKMRAERSLASGRARHMVSMMGCVAPYPGPLSLSRWTRKPPATPPPNLAFPTRWKPAPHSSPSGRFRNWFERRLKNPSIGQALSQFPPACPSRVLRRGTHLTY
jgi:hypothetical protein